jgi:hypothetical protein
LFTWVEGVAGHLNRGFRILKTFNLKAPHSHDLINETYI